MKFLNLGSMKSSSTTGEKTTRSTASQTRLYLRLFLRLLQFVMGITVIGLYATDLAAASKANKYLDSKWVFAVVVGTLSALSAVALTFVRAWFFFAVDGLIAFFYLVLFGMFGKMYISEDAEGNKGITRMKHAVWIDLVNLLLWIASAVYGGVMFWKSRKGSRSAPSVV